MNVVTSIAIQLMVKELERPELSTELREKYIALIARQEQAILSLKLKRARAAGKPKQAKIPMNEYVPKSVREAVIKEHEAEQQAKKEEQPLGQRVEQFLAEHGLKPEAGVTQDVEVKQ